MLLSQKSCIIHGKLQLFWLRKKPWMNPDLLHTLQIVILLHRLHLNKRDLNVANVF